MPASWPAFTQCQSRTQGAAGRAKSGIKSRNISWAAGGHGQHGQQVGVGHFEGKPTLALQFLIPELRGFYRYRGNTLWHQPVSIKSKSVQSVQTAVFFRPCRICARKKKKTSRCRRLFINKPLHSSISSYKVKL